MALTVWVFDPERDKEIAVSVQTHRNGKVFLTELAPHHFAGGETPRLLEKKAAFIDLVAKTFGQEWTRQGSPQNNVLREEMPIAQRSFRQPRRSVRESRQKHLRDLVGAEVLRTYVNSSSRRWRFVERTPGVRRMAVTAEDPVAALLASPRAPAVFPLPRARSSAGRYAIPPPPPDE